MDTVPETTSNNSSAGKNVVNSISSSRVVDMIGARGRRDDDDVIVLLCVRGPGTWTAAVTACRHDRDVAFTLFGRSSRRTRRSRPSRPRRPSSRYLRKTIKNGIMNKKCHTRRAMRMRRNGVLSLFYRSVSSEYGYT